MFPPRKIVTFSLLFVLGLFCAAHATDDKPVVIEPAAARQHVGKKCQVTLLVKKAKHSEKRKKYYLDSEEDFNDDKNLGIQIEDAVAAKLKDSKGVADVVNFYKDQNIKVVGTVFLEDERPYIKIEEPDQIDLVDKDKPK